MYKIIDVCRSCLSEEKELINIFLEMEGTINLNFDEQFYACTNIKIIKDDNLPDTICIDCLNELQVAYNFRQRSENTQIYLTEKLNEITNAVIEINKTNDKIEYIIRDNEVSEEITTKDENIEEYVNQIDLPNKNEPVEGEEVETSEHDFQSDWAAFDNDESREEVNDIAKDMLNNKQCDKIFESKSELEKNNESLPDTKVSFLCNICGKSFNQESSLNSHILTHQGKRPYKCFECEKAFYTKNGLRSHQLTHTPEKKTLAKYLCSECGKGFATNQRLKIHTYIHTGERNHACNFCDKTFATEFRLRSHKRTHTGEKPYECQICGLKFAQGNALKCHKRVHTGEKPYECKICLKRFSQNTILKTHMTLHTGKTVKCPDCDKKFSRSSYLILHKREHTGEKPYACDRCPNRYKQKSHLDRHMDVHNGIKHKCTICNKEYSKQWSLKMHMFAHTNEKPFKCEECAQSFSRRNKYNSHLKSHINHDKDKNEEQNMVIDIKTEELEEVK